MKVILISGKAEAGKDSTYDILNELIPRSYNRVHIAYSDYLKDTARQLWGWDGQKDEKGRSLLQWWGTKYVRAIDPDFWVNTVIRLARIIQKDFSFLIITDVRFPNEILAWKIGEEFDVISVRVERPGHISGLTEEQKNHISETALDSWYFDVVLTANTLSELREEIQLKLLPKLITQ